MRAFKHESIENLPRARNNFSCKYAAAVPSRLSSCLQCASQYLHPKSLQRAAERPSPSPLPHFLPVGTAGLHALTIVLDTGSSSDGTAGVTQSSGPEPLLLPRRGRWVRRREASGRGTEWG